MTQTDKEELERNREEEEEEEEKEEEKEEVEEKSGHFKGFKVVAKAEVLGHKKGEQV